MLRVRFRVRVGVIRVGVGVLELSCHVLSFLSCLFVVC
jgi:hypothetical protein